MKKKAKEEGIAEGVKKGREEGRAEGRAELVKAMSSRGLSPEEISHDTGLSVEEILTMLS
jgi:predicted transposase/invertase (TIGR01784 family)